MKLNIREIGNLQIPKTIEMSYEIHHKGTEKSRNPKIIEMSYEIQCQEDQNEPNPEID